MIYNVTSFKFIECEKCHSILAYEEKDTWISTDRGYDILNMRTFNWAEKYLLCPICSNKVLISRDERVSDERKV